VQLMSEQLTMVANSGGAVENGIEGLKLKMNYSEGEAMVLAGSDHWLYAKEVRRTATLHATLGPFRSVALTTISWSIACSRHLIFNFCDSRTSSNCGRREQKRV